MTLTNGFKVASSLNLAFHFLLLYTCHMSDQELRALERQVLADPSDEGSQIRLFNARKRTGVPFQSYFRLRNLTTGKYYKTYQSWTKTVEESALESILEGHRAYDSSFFSTRDHAIKEIHRLVKAKVDLSNYQLVEYQSMTLEISGPPLSTMTEQIEVEMLQAKKEAQLKKLKKIEIEEQALLEARKANELAKLKKLEEKEQALLASQKKAKKSKAE